MTFDHALRNCHGCEHWSIHSPVVVDGHIEAECREPKDSRDYRAATGVALLFEVEAITEILAPAYPACITVKIEGIRTCSQN